MLHSKIRVFSFFNKPFYCFVMYIRHSSALRTHHLKTHRFADNDLIFGNGPSSLPVMCVQNSCQKEEVEAVIYGSYRYSLILACFYQLFCRKRLRQETNLFKHYVPHPGRPHVVFTHIVRQLLNNQIMYLRADHYIFFKYARRRLWRILLTRLKKSRILLLFSSMEVVSSCLRPYLAKIGMRS